MTFPILVVDDDPHVHSLLDRVLQGEKFTLAHANNPEEALRLARENAFSVALVDLHFAGGESKTSAGGESKTSAGGESSAPGGFALLSGLRDLDSTLELVVMSSSSRFDDVRGAMRSGASDYLAKGYGKGELLHTLMHALERRRLRKIERRVRKESEAKSNRLVGDSSVMREVRAKIAKFGPAEAPVLVTGETGTGKELVASALHAACADPSAPFVPVNCAALPASTIDSFFFGHEKGAFTGADRARGGVFEEADGGTLFLDEVNSLPLELQGRLLRVLQEKKVRRLGGSRESPVDFRLVTATNQPLETLVKGGTFREDLFFRVGVLRLELPPLRDRQGDLEALVASLAPSRKLSEPLWNLFRGHRWPGNVRELKNVLLALTILAPAGEELALEHLPENALRSFTPPTEEAVPADLDGFVNDQESREKEFLARAYRSSRGNVSAMARMLNLDRSHLHQKLVKLGIHETKRQ